MLCTVIGGRDIGEKRSLFSWNIYSIERDSEETTHRLIVVITMDKMKKIRMIESDLRGSSGHYEIWGNFCNT